MEKSRDSIKYWLAFGKNSRIGSTRFSEILSKKRPLKELFEASEGELISLGFSDRTMKEILKCQKYDPDKLYEELKLREINIVTIEDDEYPSIMREIFDPPAILYYKGTLADDSLKMGIVGSRKPTDYGIEATEAIAGEMARRGITVVSGMAIGTDTVAHEATLAAGGKTIAVLGCGLDQIYPSRNVNLAKRIIENGAIVSEFPTGVPPMRYNFPIRNRIISGLSKGIIVTEAAKDSGSLITASIALEQNREVFAVPGPIFNTNSEGPNNLLKIGAKVVTSANDIFEELGMETSAEGQKMPQASSKEEAVILSLLKDEPRHIDAIIKESRLEQTEVSSVLTLMEISDKIKHIGGMVYKIKY